MKLVNSEIKIKYSKLEEVSGDPIWGNVVSLYLKNTDQMMLDLNEFLLEANTDAILGLSQMLNSSCEHVGAELLGATCLEVKSAVEGQISFSNLQILVYRLQDEYEATKAELLKVK